MCVCACVCVVCVRAWRWEGEKCAECTKSHIVQMSRMDNVILCSNVENGQYQTLYKREGEIFDFVHEPKINNFRLCPNVKNGQCYIHFVHMPRMANDTLNQKCRKLPKSYFIQMWRINVKVCKVPRI